MNLRAKQVEIMVYACSFIQNCKWMFQEVDNFVGFEDHVLLTTLEELMLRTPRKVARYLLDRPIKISQIT
jgi:hypothetical protein